MIKTKATDPYCVNVSSQPAELIYSSEGANKLTFHSCLELLSHQLGEC